MGDATAICHLPFASKSWPSSHRPVFFPPSRTLCHRRSSPSRCVGAAPSEDARTLPASGALPAIPLTKSVSGLQYTLAEYLAPLCLSLCVARACFYFFSPPGVSCVLCPVSVFISSSCECTARCARIRESAAVGRMSALAVVFLAHAFSRARLTRLALPNAVRRASALASISSETHDHGLCIIDTHNLAYRMYHALPLLVSKRKEPAHAVLGFCNKIWRLRDVFPGYRMLCVFDEGAPTNRIQLLRQYKEVRWLLLPAVPSS